MKRFMRFRPSPAMIVALIALFVALGGSASAAVLITGSEIKNGTIKSIDVGNNSLTSKDIKNLKSKDIKNGSLLAEDFKSGELPAGSAGPAGQQARQGQQGQQGQQARRGLREPTLRSRTGAAGPSWPVGPVASPL